MPFDGSGNFNRVMNWVNDALANIKIRADRHDSEDDNFAAGLSSVITKDGQTSVTANIPWNGFRLTNVGNPVNPQDAMTLAQMIASNIRYDVSQSLTAAQLTQAHNNLASNVGVAFKNANYTVVQSDRTKMFYISGACTITLPNAALVSDFMLDWKTQGGVMTLNTVAGTVVVDGAAVTLPFATPDLFEGSIWSDGVNWQMTRRPTAGQLFKRTVVTATNATWPIDPTTKAFLVEVLAAGGGGGSAGASGAGAAGQVAAAAGGGAGGYANKFFVRPAGITTANITIGAAGTGGTVPAGTGGTGGTSSWADGTNTISATGGLGGSGSGNTNSPISTNGGGGGSGSGGDLNVNGGRGGWSLGMGNNAMVGTTSIARAGTGADSPWGDGGFGPTASLTGGGSTGGTGAGGKGAGGGGSISLATGTGLAGGPGSAGQVIVWEFR